MSRVNTGAVNVEGLRELSRALKDLGPEFPREMRITNKEVASSVADDARSRAFSLGGVAAKTAPTLKASAGATSAGVAVGGPSAPWGPGAEFGGGARPTTQQFKPWRGNGPDAGYFLYPTIRDNAEQIEAQYREALDDLIARVGLDQKVST